MTKITYFDVEYANVKNRSLCQIGILCEDLENGEALLPEKDLYVNPQDGFDEVCIRVHGITGSKVKNKPIFSEIWKELEPYFTNAIVVGHNVAGADLHALVRNLRRYNLAIPEFYYVCTLELARTYMPAFTVPNRGLSALCKHFGIERGTAHQAIDDARANARLLRAMIDHYDIDIHQHVRKYEIEHAGDFTSYISNPLLRKAISEFYGVIRGFSIDQDINALEMAFIAQWRDQHLAFSDHAEIHGIIQTIDQILADGIITMDEIAHLQKTLSRYLDIVSGSPVTLATQILAGIMKGITLDGEVNEWECKNLRQWLYDNIYLKGHYPFECMIQVIEQVLEDSVITAEESRYITETMNSLLNPVETLKSKLHTVAGKRVCLSGNFAYGQKSDVEKHITERGGLIEKSLTRNTDILLIGGCECQAYSNGTYGTKVKKAIEYNEKGCSIQIIKEADYFS